MWLYFLSQNFEMTLGTAFLFLFLFLLLLQSCSWSAWLLFFFFPPHLFFWKWFKRHLEELMRQFAIYLGVFFFLLGAIQSHFGGNGMVSLTLRSHGWGPWWELLWAYWQLGDVSICAMIKCNVNALAQNVLVLLCSSDSAVILMGPKQCLGAGTALKQPDTAGMIKTGPKTKKNKKGRSKLGLLLQWGCWKWGTRLLWGQCGW